MVWFGVLLFLVNSFHLVLWNPSTEKHRTLPRCPIWPIPIEGIVGLGYDSTRDDYKVLLIATVNNKFDNVCVFGLRSNSWRIVETDFFHYKQVYFTTFGYFAHGDLYWELMVDHENDYNLQDIVSFDVANETFSLVSQPVYPTKKGMVTNLQVLDGCLCISFLSKPMKLAVLYVRKKDETAEFTWSILYSVTTAQLPPFLEFKWFKEVQVYGYSKEGDHKIILNLGRVDNFKHKEMISYDLKEKSFQTTTITHLISDEYLYAISCLQSLVSIGDGDLQETIKTTIEMETEAKSKS